MILFKLILLMIIGIFGVLWIWECINAYTRTEYYLNKHETTTYNQASWGSVIRYLIYAIFCFLAILGALVPGIFNPIFEIIVEIMTIEV